jgi:hypothetical protein
LLGRSGRFALKLKKANSTQECSLIPKLEVGCGQDETEVAGECRRCPLNEGFWQDANKQCKKKPLMAVMVASDRLVLVVEKNRLTPTKSSPVEIRLVGGDIGPTEPIVWTATSSASWLRLGTTNGTVHSSAPVAALAAVADSSRLQDTSTTGPLNATITFTSSLRSAGSVFEQGSNELTMVAELSIVADIDLHASDLIVRSADASVLGAGDELAAGSKLLVTVKAFDFEYFPISRPGLQIKMSLFMGDKDVLKGETNLLFLTANEYRAELPAAWVQDAGLYHLNVSSSTGDVAFSFSVVSGNQSLFIALGISSV